MIGPNTCQIFQILMIRVVIFAQGQFGTWTATAQK
jgi:hypothetical protein